MNRGTVEFGGIESHRLTDRQQAQQAFMMMAHASSSMTSSTSSAQQQQQQRRRRRPGFRLLLCLACAGIALIGVLLAGTYWMTTRSWFLISQIQPQLEHKLGGEVAIAQAEYQGDGKVLLTGIVLRARGVAGPAGQIASIARANVAIDLQQLFAGRVQVSDLALDDVIVRISESPSESGRFNFMALTPQWIDDDEKDPLLPPQVRIHDATFEFGTHSGGSYEAHGSIRLAGELYPAEGGEGWYNFELRELDKDGRAASDAGLFVKGEWNVATNEHRSRLEGLDFDHRIYAMCPQAVRVWWDRMQFQGQIDAMTAEWAPDQPLEVDFFVKNVSITLPFEPEGFWSRYQGGQVLETESRPRMDVRSGTIRLRNDSLILDELVGNFGSTESSEYVLPVPFTLSFALTSLPEIDWHNREAWMEKVLASSPFEMHLQLNEFAFRRSESDQSLAIDLPRVIASTLARFELTNWVLSASIAVSRGAPAIGEDGESIAARPHTSGQVYVRHASGRYQKFPFSVENVDAYLQFDNEKVVIHHLTGTGINGARLRMSGEIRPPGNDAAVSLRLRANDVPIDDELRHALSGSEAIAFDAIFNATFRDSLAAAEVLPDDRWLQRQTQELLDVQEQMASLRALDPSESDDGRSRRIAALSGRAERLRRSIETGPFVLGGMVDLDLRIERAAGRHQPTITTGAISIQTAGLLYDQFPYPLRITGGKIDWQPNRIVIVPGSAGEGLSFVTPGGGRGSINGEVSFVRHDDQHMTIPNLQIAVADDEITDLIYTSIPLSQQERKRIIKESALLWPGGVLAGSAKLVQAIGLRGSISYAGTIVRHAEDEPTDWRFELTLDDVHAEPHASLGNALGINGQVLPDNFLLRNVTGRVNINRDGVSWNNVNGVSEAVLASAQHDDGDDEKGEPDAASAAAVAEDAGPADTAADILTQIASTGHLDFRSGKPDSVSVTFTDFPLQPYLLHFVPPELLQRAQQLWGRYQPRGTIDAEMRYVRNDEAAPSTTFAVRPGNCAIEIDHRHVNMRGLSGGILFGAGSDIQVQHLVLELSRDHGRQAGTLSLDGSIQLQEKRRGLALSGQWIGGQLDSPLIPEGLRVMGAGGQAERFIAHQPAGVFDARFDVQIEGDAAPDYTIRLQPRAVALQVNHMPLYADIDNGLITFTPGSIRIDDVQGTHADGEFSASGTIDTAELIDAQLLVDHDGRLRSNFVEALLPRSVMQVFDSLAFADGGNTRVSDLHLRLRQARQSDGRKAWATDAQGRITTRNASFVAGTRFEEVDGEFDLQVRYTPGEPLHLQVDASASRATVMGVTMHDVHAPIALSADGTVLQMPELRGAIGEGMVTASAWAGTQSDDEYEIVLNMVGVPLEAVIPAQDNEASSSTTPVSRGDIYGMLHLAGHRDKPDSRRGRGLVRVLNGRVATVPLVLRMVQMLQFTLPMGGKINYAEADLYIVGNRVGFERILFESAVAQSVALQLIGEGEMTFDTLELDTQFRVRGGVPILRDIIGGLGDHLYGIEVTGPLRDPHVRLVPLPSGN